MSIKENNKEIKSFHGGDALVEALRAEDCEHVFGIPGGEFMSFLESLDRREREKGDIHYIGVRHEQAAANMADAYSRVSGKIGICCGTVGPGFVDLLPGVAPAHFDNIPILVIHPQDSDKFEDMHRLQQGIDQLSIMKPVVKYQKSIRDSNKIIWGAQKCFKELFSGRPNPVQLEIFEDAFHGLVDEKSRIALSPDRYRCIDPPAGNPEAILKACDILKNAEKPLIISGGGITSSNGWENLRKLSEEFQIPATTTVMGIGTISNKQETFIGSTLANAGTLTAANQADVVVALGTKFSYTLGYGKSPIWNENAKLIQVDIDPQMIGKNRPVDVGILGDCRIVLRQIYNELKKRNQEKFPDEWLKVLKNARNIEIENAKGIMNSNEKPINPSRLVNDLLEYANPEDIICSAGGNITLELTTKLVFTKAREPRTYLTPIGFGHLGVGLPYAIGAKFAKPDVRVFCLSGDGSVMFNIQELLTAVHYNVPIIVLVANNSAWGMSRSGVLATYKDRPPFYVDFKKTSYQKIAEGFGCYSETVEDPNDIIPALKRAENSKRPSLIDVKIKFVTPEVTNLLKMIGS